MSILWDVTVLILKALVALALLVVIGVFCLIAIIFTGKVPDVITTAKEATE